jgi:hypothetical protein
MYCEQRGRIFNFLNNSLQESLRLELVIILIIFFFLQSKNMDAKGQITAENQTIGHNRMKI